MHKSVSALLQERFVVGNDAIAVGCDSVGTVRRGEPYDIGSAGASGFQTVETVLKDGAFGGGKPKAGGGSEVAVGRRLALAEVLAGEDCVEIILHFRTLPVQSVHLVAIGTRHDGSLYARSPQLKNIVDETWDVVELHVSS